MNKAALKAHEAWCGDRREGDLQRHISLEEKIGTMQAEIKADLQLMHDRISAAGKSLNRLTISTAGAVILLLLTVCGYLYDKAQHLP